MSIEDVIDDDPSNMVPMHLREEGVDTGMINATLAYLGNVEILSHLTGRINPKTQAAFYETVAWYSTIDAGERAKHCRLQRFKGEIELKEAKRRVRDAKPEGIMKTVTGEYVQYLSEQGLPDEKITTRRMILLGLDVNIARIFGRKVYEVEPEGFGLYSIAYYILRKPIRYMMLNGRNS